MEITHLTSIATNHHSVVVLVTVVNCSWRFNDS